MPIPLRVALTTAAGLGAAGSGGYYFLTKTNKQTSEPIQTKSEPKHYDWRPFQLLSREEIDSRIRSGQFVSKLEIDRVKAVYTNQLPSNDPVEDNYSINTFQQGLIAGVYDGKYTSYSQA